MEKNKILDKLGIDLSPMQKASCKEILQTNKDIVLLSPTGTGKTYAYLIPLVQLVDVQSDNVQAVVLVPSRELAKQTMNVVTEMKCGVRAMALYGGRSTMDEHRLIRDTKPQLIFATPGRINDHLDKNIFESSEIQLLVIDEFDKCLELGFQEEMQQTMAKLPFVKRRVLLSATDSDIIPDFVNLNRVTRLDYRYDNESDVTRIHFYHLRSSEKDKLHLLSQLLLLLGNQSSIVFLNYRESVDRVASFLSSLGFGIAAFHGGLEQKERESALYKFSNGSANIFISTNLAARGLDIPDVDNIIHYHLPENEGEYIHRIGRTARWDKEGKVYFLLGPNEFLPEYVKESVDMIEIPDRLPPLVQPDMCTLYIGKGKKDKISKGDIVGFLCKIGGLTKSEIGRIDVMPRFSYVAVDRKKKNSVIELTKGKKIKGLNTLVEDVS